jgi:DNA segregation ATPase FtsK/SpoIIIE, S-DNA-T family
MQRSHLPRLIALFLAAATWVFLLVALGSFHSTDWPSHDVYPYAPVQNLCGPTGALIAYYCYLAVGQGIFPILLFCGVCLVLYVSRGRVGDLWLRAIGLLILSVAFSAAIHHFHPSSYNGFPEGQGGLLGIVTSAYLQSHFNSVGTCLILFTSFMVGLLLAADELVLHAPVLATAAIQSRQKKGYKSLFASFPNPFARTHFDLKETPQSISPSPAAALAADEDDGFFGSIRVLLRRHKNIDNDVELSYADDQPATEMAHPDLSDPGPAAAATIPPPLEVPISNPVAPTPRAPIQINNLPAPAPAQIPLAESAKTQAAEADSELDGAPSMGTEAPSQTAHQPIKVNVAASARPKPTAPPPPKELGDYKLPDWHVLAEAEHGFAESQEKFVREKAAVLEQALREFNIDAHVVSIDTGPVITMYEISLAPGIKVASITALTNDIARALAATSVRIVAPVPGKSTVGIEVPNAQKEKVRLKELMELAPEAMGKMAIPLFLGKDASGEPLVTDLNAMPHCLIAGTTGSGKSVCINTIIMSILYTQRPDMVKLVLIDPKVVEMAPFKDIPHLMCPVINDCARATAVLEWACNKMDERYGFLAEAGVRNIAGYNKLTRDELNERFQPTNEEEEAKIPKFLPYIVIIIDELADLMMTSGKEVESFIVRLAQKSRAVGIHLILATQRPQANVVTGLIKSNMPSRIAFRVASRMDSRIVLDQNGADLLLGQGDMLFLPNGANKPIRSQGTFLDDLEIRSTVKLVKTLADAQYEPELVQIRAAVNLNPDFEKDELYEDAVRIVCETKRGSVSLLQRRLSIGYARASRLIEQMAATGIVGEFKGEGQPREATMTIEEYEAMKAQMERDKQDGMTV